MKQIQIGSSFGIENLKVETTNQPSASAGEVLVRIRAASLNYRDWEVVNGQYHTVYDAGLVPLSDGSGEVVDVGAGVTGFSVGDHVIASFWQGWHAGPLADSLHAKTLGGPLNGLLSEYRVLPENGLVKAPQPLILPRPPPFPAPASPPGRDWWLKEASRPVTGF